MIEHTPDIVNGDEIFHLVMLDEKLNEVIDELNRQGESIQNLAFANLPIAKDSAKRENNLIKEED